MNLIRKLRSIASISQQKLAGKAGTSQPTIALYESGTKSPTLHTIEKLAASVGLELVIDFVPVLTREDHRSLFYHRAIVEKLNKSPQPIIKHAIRSLGRLRKLHPGAKELFDRWKTWLNMPLKELVLVILDPGTDARDMRQVSPFSGILTAGERAQIIRRFKKEHDR